MYTPQQYHKSGQAIALVGKAVKAGLLIRPDTCELCGRSPKSLTGPGKKWHRSPIHGHHWNGYGNALDVWWLDQSCNFKLAGEVFHCGIVTKDQARVIVAMPTKDRVAISNALCRRLRTLKLSRLV